MRPYPTRDNSAFRAVYTLQFISYTYYSTLQLYRQSYQARVLQFYASVLAEQARSEAKSRIEAERDA